MRINTPAILVTSLSLSKPLRHIIITINIVNIVYWGYINIVYWGYIGIMENKMETTIVGLYRDYLHAWAGAPLCATLYAAVSGVSVG